MIYIGRMLSLTSLVSQSLICRQLVDEDDENEEGEEEEEAKLQTNITERRVNS